MVILACVWFALGQELRPPLRPQSNLRITIEIDTNGVKQKSLQ